MTLRVSGKDEWCSVVVGEVTHICGNEDFFVAAVTTTGSLHVWTSKTGIRVSVSVRVDSGLTVEPLTHSNVGRSVGHVSIGPRWNLRGLSKPCCALSAPFLGLLDASTRHSAYGTYRAGPYL